MPVQQLVTLSGVGLSVESLTDGEQRVLVLRFQTHTPFVLRWGLRRSALTPWELPPARFWPTGSEQVRRDAVETPFGSSEPSRELRLRLSRGEPARLLEFALFFPESQRWDNNRGHNYRVLIPRPDSPSLRERLRLEIEGEEILDQRTYLLDGQGELDLAVTRHDGGRRVWMVSDVPSLVLHWGLAHRSLWDWRPPPSSWLPEGSRLVGVAAQTPFRDHDGCSELCLRFPDDQLPAGLPFVIFQGETGAWIKDQGQNFFVPLAAPKEGNLRAAQLMAAIARPETSEQSWTLMHRFNLCQDLLATVVPGDEEALALIFVWLRFSAIRQLDWQRNYNTKPRELSHSQDRLTQQLAVRYASRPQEREMIRLLLTTLGRGGEGQRVRDEILNIMHRHHIKEVSGHFLEEWHQKLHNNATPDDIIICQAYLEFLQSDGDQTVFRRALESGGVSQERLLHYERPIRAQPEFYPPLKGALLRDFGEFLSILKSLHSATDLATAISAAAGQLDSELRALIEEIWRDRSDGQAHLDAAAGRITDARRRLAELTAQQATRDLLYLDISLEDRLRQVIEKSPRGEISLGLLALTLHNLCLSHPGDEELAICHRHLRRLAGLPRAPREWALEGHAALERLGRALTALIDRYHRTLQPLASSLGSALGVAHWAIELFSEEVVRGRLEFTVSMLLRRLAAEIRTEAQVGSWLVISRSRAAGRVATIRSLSSLEGWTAGEQVIAIADEVRGDEIIPVGVSAVITPATVDVVSHVAVRARNSGLLLATCYDAAILEKLRARLHSWLTLKVDASGEVVEADGDAAVPALPGGTPPVVRPRPTTSVPCGWVIGEDSFEEEVVGAKSRVFRRLRGKLADWIHLPPSVAVPYGTLERVLARTPLKQDAARAAELALHSRSAPQDLLRPLEELRRIVLSLEAPPELLAELQARLEAAGLPLPSDRLSAWQCIKEVWASKWSARATRSRQAQGIAHGDLVMAVLIQPVVAAEYSFVIHTANPLSGARDEIYAEVVPGLGESLVGNYPGRALAFVRKRSGDELFLVSFPSKCCALRGKGTIFRSDSNGEDLVGFAGAGLYSSVLLPPSRREVIDYTAERLVVDGPFRETVLRGIAEMGRLVEETMGEPQDIEGAWVHGVFFLLQARPQVGLRHE